MLRLLSFCLCASIGFQLSCARNMVRRVNTEFSDMQEEQEGSGIHCVVWGDWSFKGKKFTSKEDAEEFFKKKKRTELAAIQLHGSREVSRFMSKHMTRVDWSKMKQWCGEHHEAAALVEEEAPSKPTRSADDALESEDAPPKPKPKRSKRLNSKRRRLLDDDVEEEEAPVKPQRSKRQHSAFSRAWADTSAQESSVFDDPVVKTYVPRRTVSLDAGEATSLDAKGSTLSGKVAVLEKELASLSSKASVLLKGIGVSDTTSKGASMLDLEDYTTTVQQRTNVLEIELFGAATESSANSRKSGGHSLTLHVEALAAQADELKSRLSVVESTPLWGEAEKLEDVTSRLGSKAARIFTSIGVQSVTAPAAPAVGNKALKERLGSLEEYVADVQRNAAKLEHEILDGSGNLPRSSDPQKAGTIKDRTASLGEKLHDLDSRLSALATAPIAGNIEKMENAMTSLAARAASLSKSVGVSDSAPTGLNLAQQGAALSERIIALDETIRNMQTTTAALEEEIKGSAGAAPTPLQSDTLKSKVAFLEKQVENMNSRFSSLEHEV